MASTITSKDHQRVESAQMYMKAIGYFQIAAQRIRRRVNIDLNCTFVANKVMREQSVELEGEETESISAGRSQDLTPAQQNKLLRDKEYQRQKRAKNSAAGRNRQQSASIASDDESVSGTISSSRRPLKRKAADED